ncbi:cytoskeleton-associated protein 2-like [Dreissena polymorpha]|uniref:Cytoskeleton-associated protein 2 C-terminal domain-containing protein n=1 Tax=Dreissena polymorpha TaxID=45954 RepID=A0A9D4C5J7_DREPO|nr:cytoskeleton-associated protein 2-like [Dreissena polymorpha]KAH3717822.1 hypothetical protein DPMN_060618 [Dreissena polymorpha]
MEKTKESYILRLEKWKEEKQKQKENRQKTLQNRLPGKKELPVKRTGHTVSQPLTDKRKSGVEPLSEKKDVKKVTGRKNSDSTKVLMEKLAKWKAEKGRSDVKPSTKKPVVGSHMGDAEGKSDRKLVQVKSRLFDYQNKQRLATTSTEEGHRTAVTSKDCLPWKARATEHTGSNEGKLTERNKRKASDTLQNANKRRHSEAPKILKPVKPGILKRKSCIGSFDFTDDAEKKSAAKNVQELEEDPSSIRRLSYTVTPAKDNVVEEELPGTEDQLSPVIPEVHSRNVRFQTPPNSTSVEDSVKHRKTPGVVTDKREALNHWLKSKNRTPSKFRHLMCFHGDQGHEEKTSDPLTKSSLSVEELAAQMDVMAREKQMAEMTAQMNSMLDECMVLFDAGCPPEGIIPWLNDIYQKIPMAKTSARYYVCKATVIKHSLDLDAVLEVFADATINNAQPKEDIAQCLTTTLKYVTEAKVKEAARKGRSRRRSQVQEENVFESSKVVYTVSEVTPFSEGKRRHKPECPTPCQAVTPVRRSTRRSLQNVPDSLKDKKANFSSLEEIDNADNFIFQPNLALATILASNDIDE